MGLDRRQGGGREGQTEPQVTEATPGYSNSQLLDPEAAPPGVPLGLLT